MKEKKREKNKMPGYEWEIAHPGIKRLMAYFAAIDIRKRKMTMDGGSGNGF